MIHSTANVLSDCPYPKGYSIAFILYGIFITLLFLNFYKQSYSKEKSGKITNGTNGLNGKAQHND